MDPIATACDLEMDQSTEGKVIPTHCEDDDCNLEAGKSTSSSPRLQGNEDQPDATEPFQQMIKLLAELEQDDPKVAFQAARILGLYRRMWESCVSKHGGNERLERINHDLKEENARLADEKSRLQTHHQEQWADFDRLNQALDLFRVPLVNILDEWKQCSQSQVAGLMDFSREQ